MPDQATFIWMGIVLAMEAIYAISAIICHNKGKRH